MLYPLPNQCPHMQQICGWPWRKSHLCPTVSDFVILLTFILRHLGLFLHHRPNQSPDTHSQTLPWLRRQEILLHLLLPPEPSQCLHIQQIWADPSRYIQPFLPCQANLHGGYVWHPWLLRRWRCTSFSTTPSASQTQKFAFQPNKRNFFTCYNNSTCNRISGYQSHSADNLSFSSQENISTLMPWWKQQAEWICLNYKY